MSESNKVSFFRQGGWMLFTTLAAGVFTFAVHPAYFPFLGEKGYGDFTAIMGLLNFMGIPVLGLQTVFAQETAAATSPELENRLTVAVQTLLRWAFFLWLGMAAAAAIFSIQIIKWQALPGPLFLWITVALGLAQLCSPVLTGVMQGRQNFLWLGWTSILNGAGRFMVIGVFVILLHGGAMGAALGVLVGLYIAFAIAIVQTREVWWKPTPKSSFATRELLVALAPLTFGLGASQFIFSVDYLIVRDLFGEHQTGSYAIAGTLGRGIVQFTAPLSVVMFPKIVHSLTLRKKSNVLFYTLLTTFILAAFAALLCTLVAIGIKHLAQGNSSLAAFVPASISRKIYDQRVTVLIVAELLPWFVWGMVPLALANVLFSSLMARRHYAVVIYAVAVAIAYALVLRGFGTSFVQVVRILTFFNLLFLGVVGFFTWRENEALDQSEKLPAT